MNRKPDKVFLNCHNIKYLLFDGTYFKHENCLMALIDNSNGKIVNHKYCIRENYEYAKSIFEEARGSGIKPIAITVDGNTSVIRAIKDVWSCIIIQRCLAHIQRQGLSWLRRKPKLESSQRLRCILLSVTKIKNENDKKLFLNAFHRWEKKYGKSVSLLSSKDKVFSDLKATRNLLINALPDMFHYLKDKNIPSTTNKIEGYFSRLKIIYRQHRGLLKSRRKTFFEWYIYFKN
ncbi:MAG: transposase [Patescibacteria group bacterium]